LLANAGRLQPFKPQNPLNPGANPLVTGVWDSGTQAATVAFEKQYGLPVTGQLQANYPAILQGKTASRGELSVQPSSTKGVFAQLVTVAVLTLPGWGPIVYSSLGRT